jgi:hypothetical protein
MLNMKKNIDLDDLMKKYQKHAVEVISVWFDCSLDVAFRIAPIIMFARVYGIEIEQTKDIPLTNLQEVSFISREHFEDVYNEYLDDCYVSEHSED